MKIYKYNVYFLNPVIAGLEQSNPGISGSKYRPGYRRNIGRVHRIKTLAVLLMLMNFVLIKHSNQSVLHDRLAVFSAAAWLYLFLVLLTACRILFGD